MEAQTISDILAQQHFLCCTLPDGRSFRKVLYSTGPFDLMHAAMSLDAWLLREIGFVPQDRAWHIERPRS